MALALYPLIAAACVLDAQARLFWAMAVISESKEGYFVF